MSPATFMIGQHKARGRLYASIAESHHYEPCIAESRFAAYQRPFRDEAEARAALEAAGADSIELERRPRKGRRR